MAKFTVKSWSRMQSERRTRDAQRAPPKLKPFSGQNVTVFHQIGKRLGKRKRDDSTNESDEGERGRKGTKKSASPPSGFDAAKEENDTDDEGAMEEDGDVADDGDWQPGQDSESDDEGAMEEDGGVIDEDGDLADDDDWQPDQESESDVTDVSSVASGYVEDPETFERILSTASAPTDDETLEAVRRTTIYSLKERRRVRRENAVLEKAEANYVEDEPGLDWDDITGSESYGVRLARPDEEADVTIDTERNVALNEHQEIIGEFRRDSEGNLVEKGGMLYIDAI